MSNFTEQQIQEFKLKADKWDALENTIASYYSDEGEPDTDDLEGEGSLLDIGEAAARAFGFL